ncbi:hypothetical protein HG530_001248 [Fusarium avenaceum]|nr:hypothetical protein HG530_001248 [Fusarium avenaceum]
MPSQIPTSAPRYSFMDDYSEGAHPALLKALIASNTTQENGYGGDTYCDLARQRIRRHLGRDDVGVFFVPSGTSANAISIDACLRPHEAVIAASSGHIVTRETGAVEASGHKIINVAPKNGKLTPESIERALDDNWHFPHMAKPRLVYISNATEIGTIYSRNELAAIKQVCEKNGLILFLDGARIGTALASKANDMTLADILELTDMFWIGGTKNGALLGEAVVVKDARLASEFEFFVKQHGSLLAKGRVIGAQFAELFEGDLYFDLARKANLAAETLSSGIAHAGFSVYAATETNQVFAVLPLDLINVLKETFSFYVWEKCGDDEAVIRLLTTWATDFTQLESQTLPIVRLEQETLTFRSLRKQITTKTPASPHSNRGLLRQHSFASRPRCLKCTVQTILGVNTIDAMCCIEILHNDDLETSRRALPGSNSGVGQEDLPDLKEKPVSVPSPERPGVVHANGIDARSTSALETTNIERQRRGGISTRKDVLIEEQAPDEVLVLPRFSKTRYLDIHSPIILKHIVALAEEPRQTPYANVLSHFELRDFVELLCRNVAIVAAQKPALLFRNARFSKTVVAPFNLVTSKGHACDFGTVIETREFRQSAPTASNIKNRLSLLKTDFLTNDGKLVVLHLL